MPLFTSAELTPAQTLDHLDTLEKNYALNDEIFQDIHYLGESQISSLELHREQLQGRDRYQNTASNDYILAQRLAYIVKNVSAEKSLRTAIIEAQEKYPFLKCHSDDLI